jgi:predicted Zn-dependent protease
MLHSLRFLGTMVFSLAWCVGASAQSSTAPATDHSSSARRSLELAKTGHCTEALPILTRSISSIADHELKYEAEFAAAQCAMSLDQVDTALQDLARLNRDFPHDPQVLYVTAHYCSQLASSASRELADKAPTSYQAQELDAESFEAHGKWDDAIAEYRKILEQYPQLPGIHYRLGRIILSMPSTPTTADDARKEFEAELKIDPNSAAAEFMLGDLARQLQRWDEAIEHFSRASKLDASFLEAYLGLGMALNAEGKYRDAVPLLERYVKGEPDDAAGHYQLAMAYARTGHRDQAARELARQRELDAKVNKDNRSSDGSPQIPQ